MTIRNRFVLLIAICFVLTARAQPPRPLSEIDLSKFGYQGRPPVSFSPVESPFGFWAYQQGVAFTDAHVIAAYFVVHDDPTGAAADRKPSPSDRFRLVALFFNIESGELVKKLDWPLPAGSQAVAQSFFFPAADGRFIVELGNRLILYSSDFKPIARLEAPADTIASPSGESLLLKTVEKPDDDRVLRYELVDTENLSVRKSWEGEPQPVMALWGDELAWNMRSSLYLKIADAPAKELLSIHGEVCGRWSFIGKEKLAGPVCGGADKLLTVSTSGEVIREFDLGLEQADGSVVASRNGQRFALPTFRWGSGSNKDPQQLTARVFDLKSDTPLMTLNVFHRYGQEVNFHTEFGDTRFGWGGLALSPNGELLAVKSGAAVQIYRVPEVPDGDREGAPAETRPPSSPGASTPAKQIASSSQLMEQMLSWFPADTESVMAATGPLVMPTLREESNGAQSSEDSEHAIRETFRALPLALLGVDNGLFAESLKGEPMVAAMEGSRDFRAPSGLGEAKFQGGAIAVFAGDISARANSFLRDASHAVLRTERIGGHEVSVFQEKMEEDMWTTYLAFPKPNLVVAATNAEYLREVLARIDGKRGERALPDTLPEWKHVNMHADFWAIRHCSKVRPSRDATLPFACFEGKPDPQAMGVTFSFDPDNSKTATITYLSADENSLQSIEKSLFNERERGARELHVRYSEPEAGALVGSYDLEQIESAEYFVFILEALLGHVVFI